MLNITKLISALLFSCSAYAVELPISESVYRWGEFTRPSAPATRETETKWTFIRVDARMRIKGTLNLVVLKVSIVPETEFYWERSPANHSR